jgi:hypothetical protein
MQKSTSATPLSSRAVFDTKLLFLRINLLLLGMIRPLSEPRNKMAADLTYEGCNFYRQRLVLSTLSGKSVRIKNIRSFDDDPGLKGMVLL